MKPHRHRRFPPPGLLLLGAALLTAAIPASASDKIVVKGSDTLGARLMPRLKEEFIAMKKARGEEVTFEIAAEGSRTGITALIDGKADLAMSSRRLQSGELSTARARGVNLKAIPVGVDGIAVIVNADNPVEQLSPRQVEMIFTGDIDDWSGISPVSGRISTYTRSTSSGTYSLFQTLALHRRDYSDFSLKLAGNEQVAAEVAANPRAIGYVGLAFSHTPGVKVLPVDGKLPSSEDYPLARPLYFYVNVNATHTPVVQEFIDFILSPEGQAVVESVDFLPASRLKEMYPELAVD
ncbi:PstS family phosphate ABC transporter substrate-binding protein [Ruficoccus amylovorans]|uniref:PstS family phosphate ABC transporter substrate-binding protein n=1 Tax=Ruficoccus amylovorans TaxID=1804625 RepID=A0A842HE28_9BACT|nr:PstS family phosphate ABC transporter substrate-binding protein [Ruficoccus amylovorans]MBC2594288.1 PstS family phosphate ABC transporter substrate-binding protein [Ruficoccus amylovorans]